MDQDKVDLSAVNKNKKEFKLPKGPNLFKKNSAGPGRDAEGKFTAGSGGLLNTKRFQWSRIIPLILIVALAGGYLVFRSFAASGDKYVFSKRTRTGSSVSWSLVSGTASGQQFVKNGSYGRLLDKHPRRDFVASYQIGSGSFVYSVDSKNTKYLFDNTKDTNNTCQDNQTITKYVTDASFRSDDPGSGLPRLIYAKVYVKCAGKGSYSGPVVKTELIEADANGSQKKLVLTEVNRRINEVIWHAPTNSVYYLSCPEPVFAFTSFPTDCILKKKNTTTGQLKTIAANVGDGGYSLSGDGKRIAYESRDTSGNQPAQTLIFAKSDGTDVTRLRRDLSYGYELKKDSLTATGASVIVNRTDGATHTNTLRKIATTTKQQDTVIHSTKDILGGFALSPDNSHVIFSQQKAVGSNGIVGIYTATINGASKKYLGDSSFNSGLVW